MKWIKTKQWWALLLLGGFMNFSQAWPMTGSETTIKEACVTAVRHLAKSNQTDQSLLEKATKFQSYFRSVGDRVLERDYLLYATKLSLLSREHLLMVGPPGNAKSLFAKSSYGSIVDEATSKPSYFKTQMTSETTLADTHGQINFKAMEDRGTVERMYEQGILGHYFAFLDEIFDISPRALRNILDVLAERAHGQSGQLYQGRTWSVMMASNRYISQVYEQFGGGSQPQAVLDRVAFAVYVPPEFAQMRSYRKLVQGVSSSDSANLSFQDIEALQGKTKSVEIPDHISDFLSLMVYRLRPEVEAMEESSRREYHDRVRSGETALPPWRATKYMSLRTLGKAANVLRSIIVLDWVEKGGNRPLIATLDDVQKLEVFFTLGGPSDAFVEKELERSIDPHERSQLETIQKERTFYRDLFKSLKKEFNETVTQYDLIKLADSIDSYNTMLPKERAKFLDQLKELYMIAELKKATGDTASWDLDTEKIAFGAISETLKQWLTKLESKEKSDFLLKEWDAEAKKRADELLAEAEKRKQQQRAQGQAQGDPAADPNSGQPNASVVSQKGSTADVFKAFAIERKLSADILKLAKAESLSLLSVKDTTFTMGSPEKESDRSSEENQVQVKITKPFEMMATPVTQLQWYLVMGNNPSKYKELSHSDGDFQTLNGVTMNANHPVEQVSWDDVHEFIRKLNDKDTEYFYRLPTEAEWELAARSGTPTAYSYGDDPANLGEYAHFKDNSDGRTHAVALKKPNPAGFYDIHGNVWEWVSDWYADRLIGGTDPRGPSTGSNRIVRGGCWSSDVRFLRSAYRYFDGPTDRCDAISFRLVGTPRSH